MSWIRLAHWLFGLIFVAFLGWYLTVHVFIRTHGYLTAEPPPHWDNSAIWMLGHMIGGMTVLAIGPFQFFPPFRDRFPRVHRALGKTYIVMSLFSIVSLFARVIPVTTFATQPSLYIVTTLWLLSIVAAYLSIRVGDVVTHLSFMMRGYVCASYFLLARYFIPVFEGCFDQKANEAYFLVVTDFLCWLIPLFALEIGLFIWRFNLVRKRTLSVEL